jgi:hypothetical protein
MLFWFKDVSPESFKKYLSLISHYEKFMEYEMESESEKETGNYRASHFGKKMVSLDRALFGAGDKFKLWGSSGSRIKL